MLAGDFTNWQDNAINMERRDDGFYASVEVKPTDLLKYKFIVDGNWTLDAGAPDVIDDGFGGKNGYVVVEKVMKIKKTKKTQSTSPNIKQLSESDSYVQKKDYEFSKKTEKKIVIQESLSDLVTYVKYSENGKFLLGATDKEAKIYEASTGFLIKSYNMFRFGAYSPDGKYIVYRSSVSDVEICEVETGIKRRVDTHGINLEYANNSFFSFSGDNKYFAVTAGFYIYIYNTETLKKEFAFDYQGYRFTAPIQFGKSHRYLSIIGKKGSNSSDNLVLDLETRTVVTQFSSESIDLTAIDENLGYVFSVHKNTVYVTNIGKNAYLKKIECIPTKEGEFIKDIKITSDGTLLVLHAETLSMWNIRTWKNIYTASEYVEMNSLDYEKEKKFIAIGGRREIALMDYKTGGLFTSCENPDWKEMNISSSEGKQYTYHIVGGSFEFFSTKVGDSIFVGASGVTEESVEIGVAYFSEDLQLTDVTAHINTDALSFVEFNKGYYYKMPDGFIYKNDFTTGKTQRLNYSFGEGKLLEASVDGTLFAYFEKSPEDSTINFVGVYRLEKSGKISLLMMAPVYTENLTVRISPKMSYLSIIDGDDYRLWNIESRKIISFNNIVEISARYSWEKTVKFSVDNLKDVRFSSDENFMAFCYDDYVKIFEMENRKVLSTIKDFTNASFSEKGLLFAGVGELGSKKCIYIYDLSDGNPVFYKTIDLPFASITGNVNFSEDFSKLYFTSGKSVRCVSVETVSYFVA